MSGECDVCGHYGCVEVSCPTGRYQDAEDLLSAQKEKARGKTQRKEEWRVVAKYADHEPLRDFGPLTEEAAQKFAGVIASYPSVDWARVERRNVTYTPWEEA
jgi:hypothetical protein